MYPVLGTMRPEICEAPHLPTSRFQPSCSSEPNGWGAFISFISSPARGLSFSTDVCHPVQPVGSSSGRDVPRIPRPWPVPAVASGAGQRYRPHCPAHQSARPGTRAPSPYLSGATAPSPKLRKTQFCTVGNIWLTSISTPGCASK